MNDTDRDRDGDGAGPVANLKQFFLTMHPLYVSFWVLLLLCIATLDVFSQTTPSRLRGLSLFVDAGVETVGNKQANFYNGAPQNANNLLRVLHSELYGSQIWSDLTTQNRISSSVAHYSQLSVAEYGTMQYKTTFRFGLGFRYDYAIPWAWMFRFDYTKLNAVGTILLNSGFNNSLVVTNQNAYVACPISGTEKRIFLDFGVIHHKNLKNNLSLETTLGGSVVNTQVVTNDVIIADRSYSILDVWQGESPSFTTGIYDYVNQGGLGLGGFASMAIGILLPNAIHAQLAYTFHYTKINLKGYLDFAPHHTLSLIVALNNFSFFDD